MSLFLGWNEFKLIVYRHSPPFYSHSELRLLLMVSQMRPEWAVWDDLFRLVEERN